MLRPGGGLFAPILGGHFDRFFHNEGGIEDFKKAIELNPTDAILYFNKGISELYLGKDSTAILDFNKAIDLYPDYVSALFYRGYTKANIGDLNGGINDFTKVLVLNPDFGEAYMRRGYAKYDNDDAYGACLDWKEAAKLGISTANDVISEYCEDFQRN